MATVVMTAAQLLAHPGDWMALVRHVETCGSKYASNMRMLTTKTRRCAPKGRQIEPNASHRNLAWRSVTAC